jgi:hypothetical protein
MIIKYLIYARKSTDVDEHPIVEVLCEEMGDRRKVGRLAIPACKSY